MSPGLRVRLSTGSVAKILTDASAALAEPWEAIKHAVQAGDVAHADETSWRRAALRMWLWTALSATAACFQIDQTRARSVARNPLGDFDGILVSDRYGVYVMLGLAQRPICLAHIARNYTPNGPALQAATARASRRWLTGSWSPIVTPASRTAASHATTASCAFCTTT